MSSNRVPRHLVWKSDSHHSGVENDNIIGRIMMSYGRTRVVNHHRWIYASWRHMQGSDQHRSLLLPLALLFYETVNLDSRVLLNKCYHIYSHILCPPSLQIFLSHKANKFFSITLSSLRAETNCHQLFQLSVRSSALCLNLISWSRLIS